MRVFQKFFAAPSTHRLPNLVRATWPIARHDFSRCVGHVLESTAAAVKFLELSNGTQRCFPTRQNKVRPTTVFPHPLSLSLINISFNFCLQQKENLASVAISEVVHQIRVLWSSHGQHNPLHSGFPQALLTSSSCNCFCRLALQQKTKKPAALLATDVIWMTRQVSQKQLKNRKPGFLGFSINPIKQPDLGHTPVFLNQRQIIAESSSWLNQTIWLRATCAM